jgi:hypothetical protein
MLRFSYLVLALLALAVVVGQAAIAADDKANTHEGKIVMAGNSMLTMTDENGANRHSHKVGADCKITCDGKVCKLEDLKEGYHVKVTTKGDEKNMAIKIEASSKGSKGR